MADVTKLELLKKIRFGERIAEDEIGDLERYFVKTDQWNRVYTGEVDIIYGAKGAGKSAIYALISKQEDDLFDRGIIIKNAENVRGATVFKNIVADPPPSERSFIELWKLYFLILCGNAIREYGIGGESARSLVSALEKAELLPKHASLSQFFEAAKKQIWSYLFPDRESVEWTVTIEPSTGVPIAKRKTTYRKSETTVPQKSIDIPIDELVGMADESFRNSGFTLWILFDRLDVAFNDNPEIERNALRALFRMYNDFKGFDNLKAKIFVRDDIWDRISSGGFAEASHITKTTHIDWSFESLLNLFVRRLLNNDSVVKYLNVNAAQIVEDFDKRREILKRIFPDKVETGRNPETFRWMINRIQDGTGKPAPRELIHLAECIRKEEITRLERGETAPDGEILFDRVVFKSGLKEVSKVRYEQTFLAENPSLKDYTNKLQGHKAEHILESLEDIWEVDGKTCAELADKLVSSGFFELREYEDFQSYWVPFIYRDALDLVQGKAFE